MIIVQKSKWRYMAIFIIFIIGMHFSLIESHAFTGNMTFSGTSETQTGQTIVDGQSEPIYASSVEGATIEVYNSTNRVDKTGNFLFLSYEQGVIPYNPNVNTYNYIVIECIEGTEFYLQSIGIGNAYEVETSVVVEGFRDGVLIGSVILNLDIPLTNFDYSNGLDSEIFNAVDKVCISSNTPESTDVQASINNISFSNVNQYQPPTMVWDAVDNDVDHDIEITFPENVIYENAIYSITCNNIELTAGVQYVVTSGSIVLKPAAVGNPILRQGGTLPIRIYAIGYAMAEVVQIINPGLVVSTEIQMQPSLYSEAMGTSGFATLPTLLLKDQYGNLCSSGPSSNAVVTVTAKNGTGSWELTGQTSTNASYGVASFYGLFCTKLTNGTGVMTFTVSGISIDSQPFELPLFMGKYIQQQQIPNFDVDHDLIITFAPDAYFESHISKLVYNGNELVPGSQYVVSSGQITLFPSAADNQFLRSAPQQTNLTVSATGYADSYAFMEIIPGVATQLIVTTQPVAGSQNGDLLSIQPSIELKDQYGNRCVYGISSYLYLTVSAVNETGQWTLSGENYYTIAGGVANLSGLRANVTTPGTGRIRFDVLNNESLTTESNTFDLFFDYALLSDLKFDGRSVPNFTPQQYDYTDVEIPYAESVALNGDYHSIVVGIPAQAGGVVVTSHSAVDFKEVIQVSAPNYKTSVYTLKAMINHHSLSSILVNGVLLDGFNKYLQTFTVSLPPVASVPVITAAADHPDATVTVSEINREGSLLRYEISVFLAGVTKTYQVSVDTIIQPTEPTLPTVPTEPTVPTTPTEPVPPVDQPPNTVPDNTTRPKDDVDKDPEVESPSASGETASVLSEMTTLENLINNPGSANPTVSIDQQLNAALIKVAAMQDSKLLNESLNQMSKIIGVMGENFQQGETDKKTTVARVSAIAEVMEMKVLSQNNYADTLTVVDLYLTELKKVKSGLGASEMTIEKSAFNTLQRIADKHSTVSLKADDSKSEVTVDANQVNSAIEKQLKIQSDVVRLAEQYFGDSNVNKITTKLTLEIEEVETTNSVTTVIPADIFDMLKTNKVDQLKVAYGNVGIAISNEALQSPDALSVKMTITAPAPAADENQPVKIVTLDVFEGTDKKNTFKEPVELSFSLDAFGITMQERQEISIFRYSPELAIWQPVGGTVDPATGTISVLRSNLSQYTVMKSKKSFSDVNQSWAKNEINSLLKKGIVKSAQNFEPQAYLTRGEFADWIASAYGLESNASKLPFKDVSKSNEYYNAIAAVYEKGIIAGKGKSNFDPEGLITEQEMAVIMGQTLIKFGGKKNNTKAESKYLANLKDKSISDWAADDMALLMEFGLKNSDSMANGNAYVTKETAAASFSNMYN